jgi:hypothetical protein
MELCQICSTTKRIRSDSEPLKFLNIGIFKLMEWMLTLFTDLQRCIKELAERTREDDSDEDEEESSDEDERMNGELKDSDDDVDEGLFLLHHHQKRHYLCVRFREHGIFGDVGAGQTSTSLEAKIEYK